MRCLIVSPLPTVPKTQGNAALIFRKARLLQQLGYSVDFLISALEVADEWQQRLMRLEWENVFVVPFHGNKTASLVSKYGLDDWYDQRVSEEISKIKQRWVYDLVLVNYVWMSAALEQFEASTLRIIDTHDIFGDRDELLVASGLDPTWYYTTKDEEARGFARADLILAVQEGEAEAIRSRTSKPVVTVGHLVQPQFLPTAHPVRSKLRVGYLGSANLTNRHSLSLFIQAVDRSPQLSVCIQLLVAGPVSAFVPRRAWIKPVGEVDSTADFYAELDCVINPDVGGTGVKIKTVEALAAGRAVVSTIHGTYGLKANSKYHLCENPKQVAERLATAVSEGRIQELEEEGRSLIVRYQAEQVRAFRQVFER